MGDLISRKYLYDKMLEKEELARQRVLDTPTHSPVYLRYVAQLNERTALKHEIADAPTVEPPKGEWKQRTDFDADNNAIFECSNCLHGDVQAKGSEVPFCWYCGADMRKKV